jgi:hypothetical protein
MMPTIVAILVTMTLAGLGLIHVYWALGGKASSAAIPETNGRPAFTPSRAATLLVALCLFSAAYLVAATGHLVASSSGRWPRFAAFGLAALFFGRAVGDFRLVGFFKRPSTSRFSHLDTIFYSPLCLGLALATGYVAYHDV